MWPDLSANSREAQSDTHHDTQRVWGSQREKPAFIQKSRLLSTGHTYGAYGPLLCGVTSILFGGVPTFPDASRLWQIVEKHKVSSFCMVPVVKQLSWDQQVP